VARSTAADRLSALVALAAGPPRFVDSSFITVSSYCSGDNVRRAAVGAGEVDRQVPFERVTIAQVIESHLSALLSRTSRDPMLSAAA
jgi:hypothetical protein